MISREQNERLTRIGAGTPCGELLRRYWQPLCPSGEITAQKPKKRVTVMGERLVVFRDAQGRYGCVEEFCKHRGVSLFYGYAEDDGIRCCYHGWKYDCEGRCVDMPFEKDSPLKNEIKLKAYPVQKLGGLLFAYMGPDPAKAPLLAALGRAGTRRRYPPGEDLSRAPVQLAADPGEHGGFDPHLFPARSDGRGARAQPSRSRRIIAGRSRSSSSRAASGAWTRPSTTAATCRRWRSARR